MRQLQYWYRSEVFAGKFLAALDRQHPRDLFDVWRMYESGPIEPAMLSAFVVYLCGHNRPPHEILDSTDRTIDHDYTRALVGMVRGELPSIQQLTDVRGRLRRDILTGLSHDDRDFLEGFFSGHPDWNLLNYTHARDLPSLAWKQSNLEVFATKRREDFLRQRDQLIALLSLVGCMCGALPCHPRRKRPAG